MKHIDIKKLRDMLGPPSQTTFREGDFLAIAAQLATADAIYHLADCIEAAFKEE